MFLLYFPNGGQQEGGTPGVEKRRECGGCLDSSKLRRADTKSHQESEEDSESNSRREKNRQTTKKKQRKQGKTATEPGNQKDVRDWNKKD